MKLLTNLIYQKDPERKFQSHIMPENLQLVYGNE